MGEALSAPTVVPCIGCIAETGPLEPPAKLVIHGLVSAMGIIVIEPKCMRLYLGAICETHLPLVAMAMASFTQRNDMPIEAFTAKVEELWK